MADENDRLPPELPLAMELDLLVDEELPEERRKELLKSLDKMPAKWRDLSIRFLERQVERKSARQLITEGLIVPAGATDKKAGSPASYKFPRLTWLTPLRFAGMAAGLLIVAGGVFFALRGFGTNNDATPSPIAAQNTVNTINTVLPSSVVGTAIPVQVSVVDVHADADRLAFFPNNSVAAPGSRRSIVIKPDGINNALIIPVKNLQIQ